jgi:AmmeMemoRadiSam system protein A
MGAARSDPRFAAIRSEELPELEIEISVLSEPFPIAAAGIEVGWHGLLVIRGKKRGLLLPQVARERGWSPQKFLEETCRKAGLEASAAQHPETQVLAFTAEVFSEREFQSVMISAADPPETGQP